MKLTKDEYKALEAIVGPEYITQEPVIMESYNQVWGNKLAFGEKHHTPPAAVLLPGNVEEVQAIVKFCNKAGILFKPSARAFEYVATYLSSERGILLELKRMNRILEIDEKNAHAVVEPFVTMYQLLDAAGKLGYYVGKPGVGYSASVISLACCHQEMTISQIYTSGYGRNVLGCEWVLPTGEILNLGTANRDGGWFSGDGPGFSLRGILRGRAGANGGHGVITKCSVKLYPWYAPPPTQFDMVRQPGEALSAAQIEQIPDNYRVNVLTFPDVEKMMRASTEIGQAELACIVAPAYMATGFSEEGADEAWAKARANTEPPDPTKIQRSVPVFVNGHSKRELEYREKAVLTVMEKWGGYLDPEYNNRKIKAQMFMYQIWSTGVGLARGTGDIMVSIQGADGSTEMQLKYRPVEFDAFKSFRNRGSIVQPNMGMSYRPMEHYSLGSSGGIATGYDPWDPDSLAAAREYMDLVYDVNSPFRRFSYTNRGAMMQVEDIEHIHQRWGPIYENADMWLQKVRNMLDPNRVADWSGYIPPEYSDRKEKNES
ncbi:MAG: FAD-binding oxidoreductase [Dehalococcoidales bacterium]|nr:FAD-binding oxidoreductase [Dehalococcoidales bacterium]